MTTLEYMERQVMKHRRNFIYERDRGAPEKVLHNISEKIRHYEAVAEVFLKMEGRLDTGEAVVHCQDCKHRRTDECPMYYEENVVWQNDELMPEWDVIVHDSTRDNGFCDRGERKETDT